PGTPLSQLDSETIRQPRQAGRQPCCRSRWAETDRVRQILERMGRGKPSRAGPEIRQGVSRGTARRGVRQPGFMRRLRRSAATVRRLLTGGLRSIGDRWSWESRLRAIESAGVVSFDLFGTLLLKAPGFDEDLLAAVSREILAKTRRLGVAGFPDEAAVRANLSRIQRMLTHQALAKENDPEIPRRALYEGFFGALP